MVRVNTNLLLGGSFVQTSVAISSSPPSRRIRLAGSSSPDSVSSFQEWRRVNAEAAALPAQDAPDDCVLIPSTPENEFPCIESLIRPSQASQRTTGASAVIPGNLADFRHGERFDDIAVLAPEPALRRRRDWTPPKGDTVFLHSESSAAVETWSSSQESNGRKRKKSVFTNLQDSFGCKDANPSYQSNETLPPPCQESEQMVLTKGKATETLSLGDADAVAMQAPPVKAKSTKRKARTITELAVAAYMTDAPGDELALPPIAEKKGKVATDKPAGIVKQAAINPGLPLTKVRKGLKLQPKEKTKRGKKTSTDNQSRLLSPQSAMTVSWAQDFVFGTSSQLAGNESPTFLRQLHVAMKSSNQLETALADAATVDLSALSTSVTPKLWTVSARGNDGKLTADNVIDLEEDISFPEDPETILFAQRAAMAATQQVARRENAIETDIDSPRSATSSLAANHTEKDKSVGPLKQKPQRINRKVTGTTAAGSKAGADSQLSEQMLEPAKNGSNAEMDTEAAQQQFESLTTAQLSKKVASFGYKQIKDRKTMIGLLTKCWEAKNQPLSGRNFHSVSALAIKAVPKPKASSIRQKSVSTSPAKKARKSPRRAKAVERERIVFEIEDSESDGRLSPSPEPGPLPSQGESDSGSDCSVSEMEDGEDGDMSLALSPTGEESALFGLITKAVLSVPQTNDPGNPTWHEKILMYDTIILETFTDWLNEGQLERVGYTGTVDALQTKKWCESKSVCCTWKRTLHGKERKM